MTTFAEMHAGTRWGALLVALTGIGCATIAGLDEDFQQAPGCNPILPPAKPAVKDAGDTVEFVTAIRKVDLDEEDDAPRFGYDRDGKCTCTFDEQSCKLPEFVDPKKETCDDNRGLDNGGGVALARINALAAGAISSIIVNEGATQGQWSLLIRVRDYSGTPNDDRVVVAVYETPGVTSPAWNGTDVWPVADVSVGPGGIDEPVVFDDAAYVRDGVLVARMPAMRFFLRSSSAILPLEFVSVVLTARITEGTGGTFRLTEGTVSAKWPLRAVFTALSEMRYGSNAEQSLCRDDIVYIQVKNIFCSAADILETDPPNATKECDAISFGLRFDTEVAKLGLVSPGTPPPMEACKAGFEPRIDACDN